MKIIKLSILASALVLAGCASDSKRQVDLNLHYVGADSAMATSSDSAAQAQVANAATSVSGSLDQLAAMEQAKNRGRYSAPAPQKASGGLAVRTSVDWNGPADSILRRLASAAGYSFNVVGNRPSVPVLVNISANNETISQIIRNVSYQVSSKAAVGVYPQQKVIELRYFKN